MKPYQNALLCYYAEVAQSYAAIEPILAPLAEELVHFAQLMPTEIAIDLGTGNGLTARLAASRCRLVYAVDFSWSMLRLAQGHRTDHVFLGDMHHLALRSNAFDVALAGFALNSTDPATSLHEARRILKPGGRLAIQEWGTVDSIANLLDDTLAEYAVVEPPPALAARREALRQPHPWDALEDADSIAQALQEAGFAQVRTALVTAAICLPDVETFIRYKLAWPNRQAEIDAMSPEVQTLCLGDLRENLGAFAEPDGTLFWRPNLVRICALKAPE